MANLTGLATGVKVRGIQYNNRAYVWNGRNRMRKYDGENWRNSGIVEASFTPSVAVQGTGMTGTYKYLVVPVNTKHSTYGGKVVMGQPMISAAIRVNNQGVRVANIPATADDAQVDQWWIFRNKTGFYDVNVEDEVQDYFRVATIDEGTTQYDDTTVDDALSPITTSWRNTFPPTFKHGVIFGERLFATAFDPYTTGTATVNGTTTLIDFSGATIPDGFKGCLFQADGDDAIYEIDSVQSSSQIKLTAAYSGALSGAGYSIFADRSKVWFSEWRNPDSWGIDGEQYRNSIPVGGPNSTLKTTGIYNFKGACYVFTKTQVFRITGVGPDQRSIRITPNPVIDGYGAVSGYAITSFGGVMYWLSMLGPVAWDGYNEVQPIGEKLGANWLDDINASQLAISTAGTNGRKVKFAVPQTGETENSLVWAFDIATRTFWKEEFIHPGQYLSLEEDSDGKPGLFYIQGKRLVQDEKGTNDGVPSGDTSGTVTSSTTTSVTDSAKTFYTTGSGLAEVYVHIYSSDGSTLRGRRRITSNNGTTLNWTTALAGITTGDIFYVGPVLWHWRTRNHRVGGHKKRDMKLSLDFDLQSESTESKLRKTDYVNDTADSNEMEFSVDEVAKDITVNARNNLYGIKLESRETDADIAIRDITLKPIVKDDVK